MKFPIRVALALAALAVVAGSSGMAQQDDPAPVMKKRVLAEQSTEAVAEVKACDMATTEAGKWCRKCNRILEKNELDENGSHAKDSWGCGAAAEDVKVCLKKCHEGCHKGPQPEPYKCCGKDSKEKSVKARVVFKCAGCEASAATEKEVKHKDDCKKSGPVKECCSASGTYPHGGEPKKPEEKKEKK